MHCEEEGTGGRFSTIVGWCPITKDLSKEKSLFSTLMDYAMKRFELIWHISSFFAK